MGTENKEIERLVNNLDRCRHDKAALGKRIRFFKKGLYLSILRARAIKEEEKQIKRLVFGK